jgi:hypothetical protein
MPYWVRYNLRHLARIAMLIIALIAALMVASILSKLFGEDAAGYVMFPALLFIYSGALWACDRFFGTHFLGKHRYQRFSSPMGVAELWLNECFSIVAKPRLTLRYDAHFYFFFTGLLSMALVVFGAALGALKLARE